MTTNPHAVRRATPDDVDALRAVVPAIIAENTILPLSGPRIDTVIQLCAHRVKGSLAGIIDGEDGGIAASIGLAFTEDYTSEMPFVQAVWCGLAPSVRKVDKAVAIDDPRRHYGRRLFEFAKWFHESLEAQATHPVLVRFDVLTTEGLAPKMGLFSRNLTQIGGSFALGAQGTFRAQAWPVEAEMAA